MKNGKMILGGIAVLLLAFGLVLTACDTGGGGGGGTVPEPTKFEGTWGRQTTGHNTVLVFTGNTVTNSDNGTFKWSGIFTYTDTELDCTDTNGKKLIVDYTLSGNTLTLSANKAANNVNSHSTGAYTKQ